VTYLTTLHQLQSVGRWVMNNSLYTFAGKSDSKDTLGRPKIE